MLKNDIKKNIQIPYVDLPKVGKYIARLTKSQSFLNGNLKLKKGMECLAEL
jgi:hypothetical protein